MDKRIIALSLIIALLIMVIIIKENQHLTQIENYLEAEIQKEEARLEVSQELIKGYKELQKENDRLNRLLQDNEIEWELYQITAYTSLDDGCNNISAIGLDIERWSSYFNFCAVDPEIIPYGSVVLVKFDTGIKPFLAVDTGEAIKGKHIDLYFKNDLDSAFAFGKQRLEARVIK